MTESLESLYEWLQAYIRREREWTPEEIGEVLRPLPRLTVVQCLNAHRDQHWIKLRLSLSSQFPGLLRFLGEDGFTKLSHAFIAANPLFSHCTHHLRHGLPAFIGARTELEHHAFLRDLAQLELESHNVADLPIETPVGAALLADATWPDKKLTPIHALQMHLFEYPVLNYVLDTAEGAAERWTNPTPSWVLVVRRKLRIERYVFVPEEAALMQALLDGQTLVQVTPTIPVEPWQVQAKVETWIREGLILRAD